MNLVCINMNISIYSYILLEIKKTKHKNKYEKLFFLSPNRNIFGIRVTSMNNLKKNKIKTIHDVI